jgi:uncharacterized membrane protein YdfJ with MMPL/SSD domain
LTGDAPVSADRRSALVDFEITGDSLQAAKRLDPAKEAVSAVQDAHPRLRVEQFGSVSSNKELQETFSSDLAKAELLSFPLTLLILVIAFGALVAALVPLLLGSPPWWRRWGWWPSRATSPRSTATCSRSSC